jgi:hypothetical protein
MRAIFKVRTIWAPRLRSSLTGGFWRSRVFHDTICHVPQCLLSHRVKLFLCQCFIKNHVNHELWGPFGNLIFEYEKRCAEIRQQLVEVCWVGVINERNVSKAKSGCPFVITEDLKNKVDVHVCQNRRFTMDKLRKVLPHVSQYVPCEIITL